MQMFPKGVLNPGLGTRLDEVSVASVFVRAVVCHS